MWTDFFSKVFHQVIRKKIVYVYITEISNSPEICCYTMKVENPKMLLYSVECDSV